MQAATALSSALLELGRYRAARELDEDILARKRRVLGQDDPSTLGTASAPSIDLE